MACATCAHCFRRPERCLVSRRDREAWSRKFLRVDAKIICDQKTMGWGRENFRASARKLFVIENDSGNIRNGRRRTRRPYRRSLVPFSRREPAVRHRPGIGRPIPSRSDIARTQSASLGRRSRSRLKTPNRGARSPVLSARSPAAPKYG